MCNVADSTRSKVPTVYLGTKVGWEDWILKVQLPWANEANYAGATKTENASQCECNHTHFGQ